MTARLGAARRGARGRAPGTARLAIAGALLSPVLAAGAATPPAASRPAAPVPARFAAADSAWLSGEWLPGAPGSPALVIGPRRRGSDPELRPVAEAFQRRGFHVLTFALRDSQPADRERDSLRYAVLPARWVNDMVGALRAARARDGGSGHVFAWGQGLGASLAVAAAAREAGLCDAVAAEDLIPTVDFEMRRNGTAVIPEAVRAQARFTNFADEPFSAASRLNIPVYAILVGPGAGKPADLAQQALRRNRGRTDRWLRPGIASPAPPPGPAQVDTLAAWFGRWVAFPPTR